VVTMAVRLRREKGMVAKGSFQKECLVLQPLFACSHRHLDAAVREFRRTALNVIMFR